MAKTPRILTGQVAAITGGGRGIGRATAAALLAKGLRVAIGDIDLATAQRAAAELGGDVRAYALDVTDRESVEEFVAAAEADLGPLDVFVNNAGIMQLGRFLAEDDATTQRQIDVNVHGVLHGMKVVLPRFEQRGRGHLVNLASTAGKGGFPGGATYCATKHFVVGLSEAVRSELKGTGIEIACVMPVVVKTELASGLQETRGVKHIKPEDVAEAIVDTLEHPRFDVYVPRAVAPINAVIGLLPRRGRDAVASALKADRVLDQRDDAARAAYELRASASDPHLDLGDEPRRLEQAT